MESTGMEHYRMRLAEYRRSTQNVAAFADRVRQMLERAQSAAPASNQQAQPAAPAAASTRDVAMVEADNAGASSKAGAGDASLAVAAPGGEAPGTPASSPVDVLPGHAPALYAFARHFQELYLKRATVRRSLQQLYSRSITFTDRNDQVVSASLVLQPRQPEPTRRRGHQDAMLDEMGWLATDMYQERRWKIGMAKVLAQEAVEYVQAKRQRALRASSGAAMDVEDVAGKAGRTAKAAPGTSASAEGGSKKAGSSKAAPARPFEFDTDPLAVSTRQRCLATETTVARAAAVGDQATAAAVEGARRAEHAAGTSSPVEVAKMNMAPFASIQGQAAVALADVWCALRRAVIAQASTARARAGAEANVILRSDKRDGLMAFRPPRLSAAASADTPTNGSSSSGANGSEPLVLSSRQMLVLGTALAAAAQAWVEDGQNVLSRVARAALQPSGTGPSPVQGSSPIQSPSYGSSSLGAAKGASASAPSGDDGSTSAVLDALVRGETRLRASQNRMATRVVAAWLAGAPAVLEGWVNSRGLGRTTVAAASIAAAHARARAAAVSDGAGTSAASSGSRSLVVCCASAVGAWCAAVSRFCPGLRPVVVTSPADVKQAVAGAGSTDVVLVYPVASVSSAEGLRAVASAASSSPLPGRLVAVVLDQRGFRARDNLPQEAAAGGLASVQAVTKTLADALPVVPGLVRVSGQSQSSGGPYRLLITTVMEELPQADAGYLVDLTRLLLPLGEASGKEAVQRLAVLSARNSANTAASDGVVGEAGAEAAGQPEVLGTAPMPEAEVDAAVVSAVNKAVWLLYVSTDGLEGLGRDEAGQASAPANAVQGSGLFGAPDRVERPVQVFCTPLQSTAQTRIVRIFQARCLVAGDMPALSLTHLMASSFRIVVARLNPAISAQPEEHARVALLGMPDADAQGPGTPPLPSQTSANALRLLAAVHASCHHAHLWSGLPGDARPDHATFGARIAGTWYGAVNSIVPRTVFHDFEDGQPGATHGQASRMVLSCVSNRVQAQTPAMANSGIQSLDQLQAVLDAGHAARVYSSLYAGLSAGQASVVMACAVGQPDQRLKRASDATWYALPTVKDRKEADKAAAVADSKAKKGGAGASSSSSTSTSQSTILSASSAAVVSVYQGYLRPAAVGALSGFDKAYQSPTRPCEWSGALSFAMTASMPACSCGQDGQASTGGARVGGKKAVVKARGLFSRSQAAVDPFGPFTTCGLAVPGVCGPRMLGLARHVPSVHANVSSWEWLQVVGPNPTAEGQQQLGRARIAQAVEPVGAARHDVAHRLLLHSGKLRALSSILSEAHAFGHVPLLLTHSADTAATAHQYLTACGARVVRLDGPNGVVSEHGLWSKEGAAQLASLAGRRHGVVALACCAVPSWVLKLDNWRATAAAVDAVLGPAASLHAGLVDLAVVLDYPVGTLSGLVLETLLERLRYTRPIPVLRLRAAHQLEEIIYSNFSLSLSQRSSDLVGESVVVPRVLQPHLGHTEAEIEETAEHLVVQEAQLRLAGAPAAEAVLSSVLAARAAEAAATWGVGANHLPGSPPGDGSHVCPRDRHLASPVGQAMVKTYVKKHGGMSALASVDTDSGPALGGSTLTGRRYTYEVPGPSGGDLAEDTEMDVDAAIFGHIDANSGRHVTAKGVQSLVPRPRRVQRRLAATIRGAINVLAAHQDRGGLHFSHAYGPPNAHDKRVSAPPALVGDRAAGDAARFAATATMDVLPAIDYVRNPAQVPQSAMTAPAGPMPWRTSNAARRALDAQVQVIMAQQAVSRAQGSIANPPIPPLPPGIPGVPALVRMHNWTRLTTRAHTQGDLAFVPLHSSLSGEPASNMVQYAGPAHVQQFHDAGRRLAPFTLFEDQRIIVLALNLQRFDPRLDISRGFPSRTAKAAGIDVSAIVIGPSVMAAGPGGGRVIEQLPAESAVPQTVADALTNAMPSYIHRVREEAVRKAVRGYHEAAASIFVSRKRMATAILDGPSSAAVEAGAGAAAGASSAGLSAPGLKRARLALGLPGEHGTANAIMRQAVRDAESDGQGPLGSLANKPASAGAWTVSEDIALLRAVAQYGNSWGLIQEAMRSASVHNLLPSGMAYSHVANALGTAPSKNPADAPRLELSPWVMPAASSRIGYSRSVKWMFSRVRSWVHKPVLINATYNVPGAAASATHTGVREKDLQAMANPPYSQPRTIQVRVIPGAQGGLRERASYTVAPSYTPRRAGAEEMSALHVRTSAGAIPATGSGSTIMLGSGRPLPQGVRSLSSADAALDVQARRGPLEMLSKQVRAATEAGAAAAPPDPLKREIPSAQAQSGRQFEYMATLGQAMALDPNVAYAASQPNNPQQAEVLKAAPEQVVRVANKMRAPMPLAASAPLAGGPTAAAAVIVGSMSDTVSKHATLSHYAFKGEAPKTMPPGPPFSVVNMKYMPRADPYRLQSDWMMQAQMQIDNAIQVANRMAAMQQQQQQQQQQAAAQQQQQQQQAAQMQMQAQAAAAVAPAGVAPGGAAWGASSSGPSAGPRVSQVDVEFANIAQSLVPMAHVLRKSQAEFVPWLTATLLPADKLKIVEAYRNASLTADDRVELVTSLITERIAGQGAA